MVIKNIKLVFQALWSLSKVWNLAIKSIKTGIDVDLNKGKNNQSVIFSFHKGGTNENLLDQMIFTTESIEKNGIGYVLDSIMNKLDEIHMDQKKLNPNVTLQ